MGIIGAASSKPSIDGYQLLLAMGFFAIFIPLLFSVFFSIGDRKKRVEIHFNGIGLNLLNIDKMHVIQWDDISSVKFEDDGFEKRFLIQQSNSENVGVIQYPLRNWKKFYAEIVEAIGEEHLLPKELKKRTKT